MASTLPFNVKIAHVTKNNTSIMPKIKNANVFTGASKVFDPEGLYSIDYFGRIGDDRRFNTFGVIEIKVKILHPLIFDSLGKLRALYKQIMTGKSYALWDDEAKDFMPSTEMEGQTGMRFFLKHFDELTFEQRKSLKRRGLIELVNQYKKKGALVEHVLVLPAGMRDAQIREDDGRVEEDEINELYRRLIMVSNTIPDGASDRSVLDSTRYSLQRTFNDIYDLLFSMFQGKKGFWMSKFLSRRVANGTRNVLTAMTFKPKYFGDPATPSVTDTQVGLYQAARGVLPITIHRLMRYMETRFNRETNEASLYDPKTLRRVSVSLDSDTMDKFSTTEGLDKFINRYRNIDARHLPVKVKKYVVGLIYVDDKDNFAFVEDIEDLHSDLDPKFVRPITLCELLYLCNYRNWAKDVLFITRYPIIGEGSDYPSSPHVMTTTTGEYRYELDPDSGQKMGEDHIAREFPRYQYENFLDSMVPHLSRLAGLDADFDGDTGSGDFAYSNDARREKLKLMSKKRFYISADGSLRTNLNVSMIALFLKNFTGEYIDA